MAGATIARHAGQPAGRAWLAAAVTANLLLLAYFKHADFFLSGVNARLGARWPALRIALPLGISFFTFTQIAFLADGYAGKVREYRFVQYMLFVSYFPHLIAGPVLHHKEMMPQNRRARLRQAAPRSRSQAHSLEGEKRLCAKTGIVGNSRAEIGLNPTSTPLIAHGLTAYDHAVPAQVRTCPAGN